jgi:hypothetical protein
MQRQAFAKVKNHHQRVKDHQPKPARSSTAAHPLHDLQRSIGNHAVQRLIQSPYIQTKLQVNPSGDRYAQKADRGEYNVTRMAEPEGTQKEVTRLQPQVPVPEIAPLVQRSGALEEHREGRVAAKSFVPDGPDTLRPGPTKMPGSSVGYGGGPSLHGRADADYDGGKKTINKLKYSRATGCNCPGKQPCMKATGTLVVTYKVKVKITMPSVPTGLSECKQERVRRFLKNVLGPHEQEHKRRYETYNGTTQHPIEGLGCGQAEAKSVLDTEAQRIHDDEAPERKRVAAAYSGLLDPFFEFADFDGCK